MERFRWTYGETNPVEAAVDSATVIETSDLVYQDTTNAKPASTIDREYVLSIIGVWVPQNVLGNLQEAFHRTFLGVAMGGSQSGETDSIWVATTGVFEFDCPCGTFELGDLMGVDLLAHPGASLVNQRVVSVPAAKYAVARVAKRVATPAASIFVGIRSTVMTGGIS